MISFQRLPIAVNLRIVLLKERIEEVSPPFQGGVAGKTDSLTFTKFISRPGWLIYALLYTFMSMIYKNLFNRKDLKFFGSSLRKMSNSAEVALWGGISQNSERL